MISGYAGKILWIDLSEEKVAIKDLDMEMARKYIGGVGFAAKLLWDETNADTEPLSSENPLIFMTGPLTGIVPSSSRYIVAAISPLTNIWGEAHAGGSWAAELKNAGFDGIVLKGKSKKPVYLWIRDGTVEIVDARHLWGKDTYEVHGLLRKETDEMACVATIGRAGEKLVRIACVMNDGKAGRAAARCGLGAVMGFKKLKAIAVRGSQRPKVFDEERLEESVERVYPKITKKAEERADARRDFMEGLMWDWSRVGNYPIKNWLVGTFEGFKEKATEMWARGTPYYCRTCRTGCIESSFTEEGRHVVYEAFTPLGSSCLIDNFEALQKAYTLCNKYGLDTISTGGVISFAMECQERGLITLEDTGGVNLSWGNHEAMIEMVRRIGERAGFGELLGEGVKRAAMQIGRFTHEFAMHVKGLEPAAYDPRVNFRFAVHYATSNLGAAHMEGGLVDDRLINGGKKRRFYKILSICLRMMPYYRKYQYEKTKGKLIAETQNFACMQDSLTCCLYLGGVGGRSVGHPKQVVRASDFMEWLNYATGWKINLEEFMKTGERIFNLKRMINVRRGISRKDDTLPPRFLFQKHTENASPLNPFLGEMLDEYYSYRGWNEKGIPTKEKLAKLGLTYATQ